MRAWTWSLSVATVALLGWQGDKVRVDTTIGNHDVDQGHNSPEPCSCAPDTADSRWTVFSASAASSTSLIYYVLPFLWEALSCVCLIRQMCVGMENFTHKHIKRSSRYHMKENHCVTAVCTDREIQALSLTQSEVIGVGNTDLAHTDVEATKLRTQLSQIADEREACRREVQVLEMSLQVARAKIVEVSQESEAKSIQIQRQGDKLTVCIQENQALASDNQRLQHKVRMFTRAVPKLAGLPTPKKEDNLNMETSPAQEIGVSREVKVSQKKGCRWAANPRCRQRFESYDLEYSDAAALAKKSEQRQCYKKEAGSRIAQTQSVEDPPPTHEATTLNGVAVQDTLTQQKPASKNNDAVSRLLSGQLVPKGIVPKETRLPLQQAHFSYQICGVDAGIFAARDKQDPHMWNAVRATVACRKHPGVPSFPATRSSSKMISRSSSISNSSSTESPRGLLSAVTVKSPCSADHIAMPTTPNSGLAPSTKSPQHPHIPNLQLAQRLPGLRDRIESSPCYKRSASNGSLSPSSSLSTATSDQSSRLASRKHSEAQMTCDV